MKCLQNGCILPKLWSQCTQVSDHQKVQYHGVLTCAGTCSHRSNARLAKIVWCSLPCLSWDLWSSTICERDLARHLQVYLADSVSTKHRPHALIQIHISTLQMLAHLHESTIFDMPELEAEEFILTGSPKISWKRDVLCCAAHLSLCIDDFDWHQCGEGGQHTQYCLWLQSQWVIGEHLWWTEVPVFIQTVLPLKDTWHSR